MGEFGEMDYYICLQEIDSDFRLTFNSTEKCLLIEINRMCSASMSTISHLIIEDLEKKEVINMRHKCVLIMQFTNISC